MNALIFKNKVYLRPTAEDYKRSMEIELDGAREGMREAVVDGLKVLRENGEWSTVEKSLYADKLKKVKADVRRVEILIGL